MMLTLGMAALGVVAILAAFLTGQWAGYGRGWDDGVAFGRRVYAGRRLPNRTPSLAELSRYSSEQDPML